MNGAYRGGGRARKKYYNLYTYRCPIVINRTKIFSYDTLMFYPRSLNLLFGILKTRRETSSETDKSQNRASGSFHYILHDRKAKRATKPLFNPRYKSIQRQVRRYRNARGRRLSCCVFLLRMSGVTGKQVDTSGSPEVFRFFSFSNTKLYSFINRQSNHVSCHV